MAQGRQKTVVSAKSFDLRFDQIELIIAGTFKAVYCGKRIPTGRKWSFRGPALGIVMRD